MSANVLKINNAINMVTPHVPSVTARLMSSIMEMSEEQQEALLAKLESNQSMERRRHPRKSFSTFVDYVYQGRTYKDFIQNISESGMFIYPPTPFSREQDITMTFSCPTSQKHIWTTGRILRFDNKGIGVEFDKSSNHEKGLSRSLLQEL